MKINWDSIFCRVALVTMSFAFISIGFMALNLPRDMRQGIYPYVWAMEGKIREDNIKKITNNTKKYRDIDREIRDAQIRSMYEIYKRWC